MPVRNRYEVFLTKPSFSDIFKKAYRHSRRIRILKIFLPLSALVAAFFFCWFTFFFVPATSDPVILNNEEGGMMKAMMLNPKLEGYTSTYEPYWLKAEKAYQDYTRSGVIGLQNITAEMFLGKQGRIFLDAQGGVYDNINGFLQLDKPFTITTNDGLVARFMEADIDLSGGKLSTNKSVNIQREGFYLAANALQIREERQIIHFQGGVHLVLDNQ
ncbi:LPS export ABC transporter periplasmic protein LptC [Bartonella sp. CB175]|uniref:LPS export ABC transporter periplasmic protein LptC n=1 Tax=Bartonella sp. CB175 TaxID=3112256 RepID=UPI00300E3C43